MANELETHSRRGTENPDSQPKHTAKSFVFLGWVAVVVAAYYVVHKPSIDLLALQAVVDLFLAFSIAGITGGLGFRTLGSLPHLGDLERAAFHLAAGAGIIGLAILGIGLLGILTPWLAWLGLVLGIIILRRDILGWVRQFSMLKSLYHHSNALGRFAGWFSLIAIAASLTYALAPPVKWDSLVYHLEIPRQYLNAGRLMFLDDNIFVGFPQLAEMFFTWSMALGSGTTAATTGWFFGIVAILGVGGYAARIVGKKFALLTFAILLSGESIAQGLGWAYVDFWAMLFGLCVIISLDKFHNSRQRFWLVWAGVLTGFAVGTKYPAFILLVLGMVLLIFDRFIKRRLLSSIAKSSAAKRTVDSKKELGKQHFLFDLTVYAGLAFLFALPWLAKNFVFSGNPVYPFFFPGGGVDALRQDFYSGLMPDRSLVDDLLLPWKATVLGVEGGFGFNTSIGPLMLALIPGLLLRDPNRKRDRFHSLISLCVFGAGVWVIWAAGAHISGPLVSSRLYFFSFPALAVLAAAGFRSASNVSVFQIRVGRVAGALVVLALGLGLINQINDVRKKNPLPVILGSVGQEDYLSQELGWYYPVMQAINDLPQDSRILFLWETRAYYCTGQCSPDVVLDRWWHMRRTNSDLAAISDSMQDQGFTHVLIYEIGADFERARSGLYEEVDWLELQQFRQEQLSFLHSFDGFYTLYSLKASE